MTLLIHILSCVPSQVLVDRSGRLSSTSGQSSTDESLISPIIHHHIIIVTRSNHDVPILYRCFAKKGTPNMVGILL